MERAPTISVVVPTYARPELLRRAVGSVLAQDIDDWELIVSDDERPSGEAFEFASSIARHDDRVRVVCNAGARGQAGNTNHAMSLARGRWIKPLHDDDVLDPPCLRRLRHAAEASSDAAIVQCLARKFDGRGGVRPERPGRRPLIEEMDGRSACLAMYTQDVDLGVPSQMMVRAEHVRAGSQLRPHDRVRTAIDTLWYIDLLSRGSIVFLNEVLVEYRQDGHATATSELGEVGFFRECEVVRDLLYPIVEPQRPPSVEAVRQMLRLIRAAWNAHQGRPWRGARLAATCWRPEAWALAARWLLRRAYPGMFEAVPRRVVVR